MPDEVLYIDTRPLFKCSGATTRDLSIAKIFKVIPATVGMEITDVETYTLCVPMEQETGDSRASITNRYWVVVEIETDAGYVGTGWMGTWRAADVFEAYLTDHICDILLGRDPFATEALRAEMRSKTLYYPGELGMSAHPRSAVDVALWDIKAKKSGEPLYKLLGGEDRKIPTYVSHMDATFDLDELIATYEDDVREGFTVFKTKVGDKSLQTECERLRAIRDVIGSEATLLADANQAWTVKEAIQNVDTFDEFNLTWVEEPVSEFNADGYRRIADQTRPSVAGGEMFYRPERFHDFLLAGGMEVAQPDLIRCGGVTGQYKIALLANIYDVPVAPHLYYATSAHVVSAAPNGWMVEYVPRYDVAPLLQEPPQVRDGVVILPDEPGHGYRIDPDVRNEYLVDK